MALTRSALEPRYASTERDVFGQVSAFGRLFIDSINLVIMEGIRGRRLFGYVLCALLGFGWVVCMGMVVRWFGLVVWHYAGLGLVVYGFGFAWADYWSGLCEGRLLCGIFG